MLQVYAQNHYKEPSCKKKKIRKKSICPKKMEKNYRNAKNKTDFEIAL